VQTFNAPDLRGRVPIGQGQGPALPPYVLGEIAGEDEHVLIENEMPVHSHGLLSSTATAGTPTPAATVHLATASAGNLYAPAADAAPYETMAACVALAGSSLPHNNIMPTVVGNYCICSRISVKSRPFRLPLRPRASIRAGCRALDHCFRSSSLRRCSR